jgi:hypothetical protein
MNIVNKFIILKSRFSNRSVNDAGGVISKEDAEKLQKELEEAGAKVSVK